MQLTRLIYYSENEIDTADGSRLSTLADILRASNRNNRLLDLTGALVCDDRWFLQMLEGERRNVWRTYERIRDDERHGDLVVAEVGDVDTRIFANWWMGLAVRTAKTESVFARFSRNERFDPRLMSAAEMREMMVALARVGLSRELAQNRASSPRRDDGGATSHHA